MTFTALPGSLSLNGRPLQRRKCWQAGITPAAAAQSTSGRGGGVGRWVLADSHSNPIYPLAPGHVPSPLRPQFPHLHNEGDDASWQASRADDRRYFARDMPSPRALQGLFLLFLLPEMETTMQAGVWSPASSGRQAPSPAPADPSAVRERGPRSRRSLHPR